MWSDNLKMTGANKDKTINTAELDNNLMHIMGLKEKNAPSQTFWQDDNYQFIPEINWPYWKNKF